MVIVSGKYFHIAKHKVTLDGAGAGTKAVIFESPFVGTPHVSAVPYKADSGTYTPGSTSKTGTTITVAGSDILSQDVDVWLIATEKP